MAPKVSNEEGENGDEEAKSTPADAEEVNEEVLLLGDQDEEVDTTQIIDADIEKEDTFGLELFACCAETTPGRLFPLRM